MPWLPACFDVSAAFIIIGAAIAAATNFRRFNLSLQGSLHWGHRSFPCPEINSWCHAPLLTEPRDRKPPEIPDPRTFLAHPLPPIRILNYLITPGCCPMPFKESTVLLQRAAIIVLLFLPSLALAQSAESAVGGNSTFWAGGEVSSFNPDYSCSSNKPFGCPGQLVGPAAFFDFNVSPRWGAEGEARWLHWNGDGGQIESSYLAGGRYRVAHYGRLGLWVKLLLGGGLITTPGYPGPGSLKGSYFAYSPGGTARVSADKPNVHSRRLRVSGLARLRWTSHLQHRHRGRRPARQWTHPQWI